MGRKVAVVTGASSGIGRALAVLCAKDENFDAVYAVARRKELLNALKEECGEKVIPLPMDVTEESVFSAIPNGDEPVFVAACAGVGFSGSTCDIPLSDLEKTVDLNDKSLVSLCYEAVGRMKAGGRILIVASAAAFSPQPYFAVYAASKSFALSFSRALGKELKPKGIYVTALCPGPVDTEFFLTGGKNGSVDPKKKKYMVKPEVVARAGLSAVKKGKEVCIPTVAMKCAAFGAKVLPHKWIMRRFKEQK